MNKKILCSTTALVAAGLMAGGAQAADPVEVGISGNMQHWFGYTTGGVDGDGLKHNEWGHTTNNEVHFRGATTLDNGIRFAVRIELEGEVSGDTIDQQFVTISGGFGQLEIGSINTAAYRMSNWTASPGIGINSGWLSAIVPGWGGFRRPLGTTHIDIGNDDFVISYFTPRWAGFQVGASFQPDAGAVAGTTAAATGVTTAGNPVRGTGSDTAALQSETDNFHNGVTVGVNYVENWGGLDVAIATGYYRQDQAEGIDAGDFLNIETDPVEGFSVTTNFGFGSFILGAGYAELWEGQVVGASRCTSVGSAPAAGGNGTFGCLAGAAGDTTEGYSWDVDLSYGSGPWRAGVHFIHGEEEGRRDNPDNRTQDSFKVGFSYTLGPGISTDLSYIYTHIGAEGSQQRVDQTAGNNLIQVPPANITGGPVFDSEAHAAVWGIRVGF